MACEYLRSHGVVTEVTGGTSASVFGAGHPLTAQILAVDAAQFATAQSLLAGYTAPVRALGGAPVEGKRYDGYYDSTWNERERAAESAYRAAVIGWFVPLVSWWAVWQLLRVAGLSLPLNAHCARRAKVAAAVMAVPAMLYFVLLLTILWR